MPIRSTPFVLALTVLAAAATGRGAEPDKPFQTELEFFRNGGVWSFRIVGIDKVKDEKGWVVLVFTSKNQFASGKLKSVKVGTVEFEASEGQIPRALKVLKLQKADRKTQAKFFERFAEDMKNGKVAAVLAKVDPPKDKDNKVTLTAAVSLTDKAFLEFAEALRDAKEGPPGKPR